MRGSRVRKADNKKRHAYASGGKKLKMNDARLPEAKSQRQKMPRVRVRRQKAENERRMAAGSKRLTTKNAMRRRQAAKG